MDAENLSGRLRSDLEARRERVVRLTRERGLRGLLVYSDAGNAGNVRYLTNYAPLFGTSILLVRDDGEQILLTTFNWDAPRARLASGVERIDSGFNTGDLVIHALGDLGLETGDLLGLVGANEIPHVLYDALTEHGSRPDPIDVQADFENLRLIKSPVEQELLKRAAAATDDAINAVLSEARAGATELELAALAEYHMKKAGAEGLAFPASIASGPNTEKPVSLPSARALQPGDLVMMDVGATWEGYSADVTRTFVVGVPSQRQREIYAIVSHALEGVTQTVRPGVAANELHRAAVRALDEHDLAGYFTHRVGHGIGLETSLEAPDLQRDERPLRPGMTFCVEPGVYIPGFGGIKIEDDIVVGTDGPEVISHARRDLVSV